MQKFGVYETAELHMMEKGYERLIKIAHAHMTAGNGLYVITFYEGRIKIPENKRTLIMNDHTFRGFYGIGYARGEN